MRSSSGGCSNHWRGCFHEKWAIVMKKAYKNKYRAQPVVTEEGRFASKKEYADWCALRLREKLGHITHLQRQVPFDLTVNGEHVTRYVADAVFFEGGKRIVADSKGVLTPEFKLKAKLLKALLNIEVVIL
jgi:hypothetical protein